VNGSVIDVWIMLVMGGVGYVIRKCGFETAPVVLGLVLAPLLEMSLRQSLAMSDGSYAIFLTRPIATTQLGVGLLLLVLSLRPLLTKGLDWRARLALAERGETR
jgi:putative tricarboxylic transport membrane protein